MPEANPASMQAQIETTNLKAMGEFTNQLVAAFNTIVIGASQNFTATMDALNKQMLHNLDFANKTIATRLEIDPLEPRRRPHRKSPRARPRKSPRAQPGDLHGATGALVVQTSPRFYRRSAVFSHPFKKPGAGISPCQTSEAWLPRRDPRPRFFGNGENTASGWMHTRNRGKAATMDTRNRVG